MKKTMFILLPPPVKKFTDNVNYTVLVRVINRRLLDLEKIIR